MCRCLGLGRISLSNASRCCYVRPQYSVPHLHLPLRPGICFLISLYSLMASYPRQSPRPRLHLLRLPRPRSVEARVVGSISAVSLLGYSGLPYYNFPTPALLPCGVPPVIVMVPGVFPSTSTSKDFFFEGGDSLIVLSLSRL